MAKITRQIIFEQAGRKLRQDFSELTTVPHSALKGSEAENLVRRFLDDHIPRRFAAGSGFIIDPRDAVSRQTDVIVYDALNCPVYRASNDAGIFPSDNVAAAIEVKSRLTSAELEDAFEKTAAVKSLSKRRLPGPEGPHRSQTLGCVFAFTSELASETLLDRFTALVRKHGLGRQVDLLVVLDSCVVVLAAKLPGVAGWSPAYFEGLGGPAGEGTHIAASLHRTGDDSLDYFFRLLLVHLTFFRHLTDHPGFNFAQSRSGGEALMHYISSITNEEDPARRDAVLQKYAQEATRDFRKPAKDNAS